MDLELGVPNLEEFAATLIELARNNSDLIVVTGDSRGSGKLVPFGEEFPDQIVEVGIAEQNLVGISAGLASTGKKVFAVSPACFLTTRALEQIRNDVCYSDNPVKLIGISAGVSYGALGSTHHSIHDIAALRAINNIDIVVPADNFETRRCIKATLDYSHPIYIRFGKRPMPRLHDPDTVFEIGKAITIRAGEDVAFVATGETVYHACMAAEELAKDGLSSRVVSMHTIRPLDIEIILKAAHECSALITVEEHMIYGGLGEACAGVLVQAGVRIPMKIVAIPDEYTVTGKQLEIFKHYGISARGLARVARDLLPKSEVGRP
jgi:transketolase